MNLIDLFLFLIILIGVFSGYQKGFVLGTVDLLLLFLGLIFAFRASGYVAVFFEKYITSLGVWTLPLAFIISYIFAYSILSASASKLIEKLPLKIHENVVNKAMGVIPGTLNGIIYAAVISTLLLALPLFDALSARTRKSSIADALTPYVQWAENKLSPVFENAINHSINNLTVEPASEKSVSLSFTVKNPRIREDLEAEMLELINGERQKNGLQALEPDPAMRDVARAHSRDMFAKGYFSHINKEGQTPAQRARTAGVHFLTSGENLALAQTLMIAHEGLMNSPGHRANILRKSFGRVGIGVLEGGRHGLMITQIYRNQDLHPVSSLPPSLTPSCPCMPSPLPHSLYLPYFRSSS